MSLLLRTFNDLFSGVGCVLSERIVERRRPWRMWCGSSCIEVVFGENRRGEYLEYYCVSKFASQRRGRIYLDGSREELDAEQEFVVYNPASPGSLEAADAAMLKYNRRIESEKRAAGFGRGPDHSLIRDTLPRAADLVDME